MKNIEIFLLEANSKPSDLKKYKTTARKETVRFRDGDIYDFSDPGYDDEFTYYDGSGDGYIKDKQGHVYDVVASTRSGDAGRIAGGSTDYYVCIKKANGTDDFVVHGYIALFSKGSNTGCVDDISRGYYLEDYIAKYYNEYTHGDKFKDIASKGNPDAKPYETQKAEDKKNKIEEFGKRYLPLPSRLNWEINDSGFELINWHPGTSDELRSKKDEKYGTKYWIKDDTGKNIPNPDYEKLENEVKEIQKKLDDILFEKLKPILVNRVSEVFKTKDIDSLKGISGSFNVPSKFTTFGKGKNEVWDDKKLALDTKTKNIVTVAFKVGKVLEDNLEMTIDDTIYIDKSKMSAKMEKLFSAVAKAWKKAEGRKQTEYVEDHWYEIWQSTKTWTYGDPKISKGDAKKRAIEDFKKLVHSKDWNSNTKLSFSLSLIQVYVEGDMDPEQGPVEKPLEDPTPSEPKERGKETKMSGKTQQDAYQKMQDWHDGKRKQNVGACSDAKLKMNYKVCVELGFDKEAEELKAEADKRGIVLEKLSIVDFIEIFESNDEE